MKIYLVSGFGTSYTKYAASTLEKAEKFAKALYESECERRDKRFKETYKEDIDSGEWEQVISIRPIEIDEEII